jgi:hypothetical protein
VSDHACMVSFGHSTRKDAAGHRRIFILRPFDQVISCWPIPHKIILINNFMLKSNIPVS